MNRYQRYLDILGCAPRPPDLAALTELTRAHLSRIPFETVSKSYYKNRFGLTAIPDFDLYLDGIERNHFGGTCYSCNHYLNRLLLHLGYDVTLCSADMQNPDVHLASIVTLDGDEFIVDAGYAAPFLEPLPRDRTEPYRIELGGERYELMPQDDGGRSQMILYRNGVRKHGYLLKPEPRSITDFGRVIADSYLPTATFMNSVLMARFDSDYSIVIHNFTVIESRGPDVTVTNLTGMSQLASAIEEIFQIPAPIAELSLSKITNYKDAWS